LYRIAML